MKRLLSILLSVMLCLSMLSVLAAAADPVIRISSATANAGGTVDVTISLENNPGIVSMGLEVSYDKNALTLTGVTDGGILGAKNHNPKLETYPYILSWENDTSPTDFTANGTIVTLTFSVASNAHGAYPITVNYDHDAGILNQAMSPVYFNVTDGAVMVPPQGGGGGGGGGPLEMVSSYNKTDKTATLSVVTLEETTLSNYDAILDWDSTLFTLTAITNEQPDKITFIERNLTTGKVSASANAHNVTFSAGDTLVTYTLTKADTSAPGSYDFSLCFEDVADEDGNALDWKGMRVFATVSSLSADDFESRGGDAYTLDYETPDSGDFTITSEKPCIVLYSDGTDYQKMPASLVGDDTYAFSLPADYDSASKIVVAVKADFNGNGEVNPADALQVLCCAAGNLDYTNLDVLICDMNGDKCLTSTDTLQILRVVAGLRTLSW